MSDPIDYELERLHGLLATDDRVGELDLEVRVAGGDLYVTGNVATAAPTAEPSGA